MSKGVHGIDAPSVAGVVVCGAANAVDGRIAHVDVGRGHVNFGAQNSSTIGQLAIAHFAETAEVFLACSCTEGAVFTWVGEVAAVDAHVFG